ncbi:A/G-specific adenine glycosylase [Portibacter lacus]|uniref:Adenine DNA glycosylase n=1 Tax=Portibacter lacus TaxID=1099794 RepID=A0AA37SRZ4_9BACT|nr:A/G-specific adenine glycosylase [Portibacter lacus]GLR19771.1 A/G-specific adenine glycosylase [Portibacter lacus]
MASFSSTLLSWHETIQRELPWKDNPNVFHIWLSEIILQQTRVEQGIPYFLKFRNRFKTVKELAECSDEELMKLWEGLGYYSRARNLHKAAKLIHDSGGNFPDTYEGLKALPGIGPYTAAAIGSFAYGLPVPVVDGNVNRVISRIFGIREGIDTKEGKALIEKTVEQVFDKEKPAAFNQAIMDFGALFCKPKNSDCNSCVFNDDCYAFQNEMVSELPLKVKKIKKVNRSLNFAVISYRGKILIKKRIGKDIWRHLHDFYELTADGGINEEDFSAIDYKLDGIQGPIKHVLTHQNLSITFHNYEAQKLILKNGTSYFLVERENLRKFAFPKAFDWYFDKNSIYLKY